MTASEPRTRPVSITAMPTTAWLELFYDLIFVAAILVFSSAVSHLHDGGRIAWIVGVFTALWWVWFSTTMFVNRFRVDDVGQRIVVVVQMFLVVVLAVEALEGVQRDSIYLSITFAALMGTLAVMYGRPARTSTGPLAAFATSRTRFALASAAVFIVAAPFDNPVRAILWGAGLAITIIPAVVQSDHLGPTAAVDERHAVERMGAFTIIVCGEAFVKIAIAITAASTVHLDLVALVFQFMLTFAIWTSYFEDIPHAGIAPDRFEPWTTMHLVVQLSIAATAIGVAQLVPIGPLDHLPAESILEITASLAALYVGLGLLGACTRRRPVRPLLVLRLGTAVVVVVVGVLSWRIPQVDVLEGTAALIVVALVHAFSAGRLRGRTEIRA
jgi:low temperature requirement protein LtrA